MTRRWPVVVLAGRKGSLGDPRNQGWQEKAQIQAIPRAKPKPPSLSASAEPFCSLAAASQSSRLRRRKKENPGNCAHFVRISLGQSLRSQSGRQDSNLRPSAFQALPGLFGRCNPVEYEEKQLVTRPSHGNQKRDFETNCLKAGNPSGAGVLQD